MRSSKLQLKINKHPLLKLAELRIFKSSGHVIELYPDTAKIWREYIVKKGVVKFWIYAKNGNLITKGTEK